MTELSSGAGQASSSSQVFLRGLVSAFRSAFIAFHTSGTRPRSRWDMLHEPAPDLPTHHTPCLFFMRSQRSVPVPAARGKPSPAERPSTGAAAAPLRPGTQSQLRGVHTQKHPGWCVGLGCHEITPLLKRGVAWWINRSVLRGWYVDLGCPGRGAHRASSAA